MLITFEGVEYEATLVPHVFGASYSFEHVDGRNRFISCESRHVALVVAVPATMSTDTSRAADRFAGDRVLRERQALADQHMSTREDDYSLITIPVPYINAHGEIQHSI